MSRFERLLLWISLFTATIDVFKFYQPFTAVTGLTFDIVPNMPHLVRCKDFDDQGKQIGSGCYRGQRCGFIHPTDSRWAMAARKAIASSSFQSTHSRKRSWGAPPTSPSSKSTEPAWDSAVWTAGSSSSSSSRVIQDSGISSRYSSGWKVPESRDGDSNVAPSGSGSGGDNSSTWGSGWDSAGQGTSDSSTDNGWGTWGSSAGGSWDTSGNSGWGASDSSAGGGWGSIEGDSSSTVVPKPKQLIRPDTPRNAKQANEENYFDSDTSNVKSTERAQPPISLPASTAPTPIQQVLALPQTKEWESVSGIGNLKRKLDDLSGRERSASVKTPTGPKERIALYGYVIKNIQSLVILQVLLDKAVSNEERWKRTQACQNYHYPTPATIVKLDNQRIAYFSRVQDVKKRRDRVLKTLIGLPDLNRKPTRHFNLPVDRQKVASYTLELQEWFQDLDLHRRILRVQDSQDEIEAPEATTQETLISSTPPRAVDALGDLRRQRDWTWDAIKGILGDLEHDAQNIAGDQMYPSIYTNDDMEEYTQNISKQAKNGRRAAVRRKQLETIAKLKEASDSAGTRLGDEAVKTGDLVTRFYGAQPELDSLRDGTKRLHSLTAEAQSQLEQFEQWQRADEEHIRDITQRLRVLHTYRRSSTTRRAQRPVNINDIAPELRQKILESLQSDIMPALQAMVDACRGNSDMMKVEMEQLVAPVVDRTNEICDRVKDLGLGHPHLGS